MSTKVFLPGQVKGSKRQSSTLTSRAQLGGNHGRTLVSNPKLNPASPTVRDRLALLFYNWRFLLYHAPYHMDV